MYSFILIFNCLVLYDSINGFNHSSPSNKAIAQADWSSEVLAIHSEFDSLAVATREKIYIYKQEYPTALANGNLQGSIILPKLVSKNPGYLELKLLTKSQIFYCDNLSCSLCTLTRENSSCSTLILEWDGRTVKTLRSVSVTRAPDKIVLRAVDSWDRAAILTYPVRDYGFISPEQIAPDAPYIMDIVTVQGFTRGMFSYFVGSTYQPYEPFINANLKNENRTIVKITRICSSDKTKQLESRMDVAIDCDLKDPVRRVDASFFDSQRDQLTLVVATGTSPHIRSVCLLDMDKVEVRFNEDWNTCQKTSIYDGSRDCETAIDDSNLKDHCYIFTRRADGFRMQTCIKFGLDTQVAYKNCELDKLEKNAYRYGWLEDFKPFNGVLIARMVEQIEKVTAIIPDSRNGALFLAIDNDGQNKVIRLRSSPGPLLPTSNSPIIWTAPSYPQSYFSIGIDESKEAIFILNGKKVSMVRISCSDLYDSCEALAQGGWMDPLSCVWCPDEHRHIVISSYDKFACTQPLTKMCPPVVDHANRNDNHSEWEIFGSNLDKMEDVEVYVCDERCKINKNLSSSSKLLCFLSDGSAQDPSCLVRVVGRLGEYPDFTLNVKKTTASVAVMAKNPGKEKSSRAWKAVLAVTVVLIILVVLMFIIWQARKRIMRMEDPKDDGTSSTLEFVPTQRRRYNGTFRSDGRYVGTVELSLERISMYEQMFRDIDNRLKIDFNKLKIDDKIIGKGNFGVVKRGIYIQSDDTKREVACKMIKEGISGVTEFISEGRTMARFNHPRVMQLIGISFTHNKAPIIITDYMVNGDLVTYLRDADKSPTLRNLLQFGIQIAQGMEYLHSCNFIHRDLAARNCMLDISLNIKIADFGLCRELNKDRLYEPSIKDRDLPLRWMAIEALQDEKFTAEGDVWAYGVVLWELTTRGVMPYGNKSSIAILEFLLSDQRLEMPTYCPLQLYNEIMLPCWSKDPEKRPKFTELVLRVENLIKSMENCQRVQLYSHYEKVSSFSSANNTSIPTEQNSESF